jgi:queuine tRNA-ribosyltransferase
MALDECVELPAEREYLERSVELTVEWAKRCKEYFEKKTREEKKRPLIFGIVQGGLERDLREQSAAELNKIGFDGYAIGGLAVGETEQEMCSTLDYVDEILPNDKPRYLMGVGYPRQIVEAVKRGIDMFDCVIPTREARHGRLYLWQAEFVENNKKLLTLEDVGSFYKAVHIRNEIFKFDLTPINKRSKIIELKNYSKAYLRHLFDTEDPLGWRLATLNNLEFYLDLMRRIQEELK